MVTSAFRLGSRSLNSSLIKYILLNTILKPQLKSFLALFKCSFRSLDLLTNTLGSIHMIGTLALAILHCSLLLIKNASTQGFASDGSPATFLDDSSKTPSTASAFEGV